MTTGPTCSKCGARLPDDAPGGNCPACLLRLALPLMDVGAERPAQPSLDPRHPTFGRIRYFGNYELLEEIARGGMGIVFKARQVGLNRLVAVKMLPFGEFASDDFVKRFRVEAQAVASLQHPNIVAIHEIGVHEGQHYFSMDFVDGQTLAERARDNPLPPEMAADYVRTIAEAIHHAHQHGVLHRDLKPSNVLIDLLDQPRITDFGLAKRLQGDADLTLTGQVFGTPNFMPPEQAGAKRGAVSTASDVYSLGAILFFLLTGRPPFQAQTFEETLRQVLEAAPPAPHSLNPAVPRDLEIICLKCLNKEPRARYDSAAALAADLARWLAGKSILARPASFPERAWRWCRRRPALASVSALSLLLLVAVTVVSSTAALRLNAANRAGREILRESLLAQAHANRWSGRPGRRFDSLDALRKAAEIRPGLDLRNEAIAAMALVDVRPVKHWPVDHARQCYQVFDRSFERYLRTDTNGTITVHRTSDDHELMRWPGPGVPVVQTIFNPDGRLLVAAWRSNDVSVLKVGDLIPQLKIRFETSYPWIRGFCFSPDGRKLVLAWTPSVGWTSGNDRSIVTIYDAATWREITSFAPGFLPYCIVFDSTGERLAIVGTESRNLEIRSAETGEMMQSLSHDNGIHYVAWSPNGNLVATSCGDLRIHVWDLSRLPPQEILLPSDAIASALSFNRQGTLLISGDWSDSAKIWNVNTGKELLRWPVSALAGTGDRWISCYSTWNRLELFDLSTMEECRILYFKAAYGGSYSLAFSPNGQMLISTHRDGLRFWDPASDSGSDFIPRGEPRTVQFTRDGRGFVSAEGSELLWWPVQASEEGGTNCFTIGPVEKVSRQPTGVVNPTNRLVVAANGKAYVLDGQSHRIERRITPPAGVYSAALSPDGRHCATWSLNKYVVEVWNADDGQRLAVLDASNAVGLGFSPDGRWLVTGSSDEYRFWARSTWHQQHSISRGMTGGSHGRIAFTPDGKLVALAVGRGDVALVDATTYAPLAIFEAPERSAVSGIAFSPDAAQLAVSTQGAEIRLWNLAAIRRQLAAMNLDFDFPSAPPRSEATKPIKILAAVPSAPPPLRVVAPTTAGFPPRNPRCRANQIDLTRFYNATLTNSWFNPKWERNDLSELPRGLQTLDGIQFDIRGVVQLSCSSPELALSYPKEIEQIPIQRRCDTLHFLHANGWPSADGTDIGEYVIHFEDGTERTVPLTYAENIWNWWDLPGRTASMKQGTRLAWRGRNPLSASQGSDLLLFHFCWKNPRPEVSVAGITFRSRMTPAAPFLIALTAE